jgi:hypothetical protein
MKAMQEKAETERKIDIEEMIARIDANTKATLATQIKMNETKEDMKIMQENIKDNLKKTMEEMMTMNQAKTEGKLKELTETIEKTQMVLQTVELSFDTQARNLQENLEVIKADLTTDLTMVGIEVKTTRKEALTQQHIREHKIEAN